MTTEPARALVTGVRRGIGHAVVSQLLADGMKVAGTVRDPADFKQSWNGYVELVAADATNQDETTSAVNEAAAALGGLDVVVANAGRGSTGSALTADEGDWHDQTSNKMLTVTNLVSAVLTYLKQSDRPRIIVIGGVTALSPDDGQGVVSAMRAAQLNLVVNLANRLAGDGICVNTVLLGAIATDRQREKFKASGADDYDQWVVDEVARRGIPFGRFGTAEEVAALVGFLASEHSGYITGAAIPISGGLGNLAGGMGSPFHY